MSNGESIFYARSNEGRPYQELTSHLRDVASGAERRAQKFGAGKWGYAAGLLHDVGKFSYDFQARLRGEPGPVDHSTAGAQVVGKHYGPVGNLIAASIAGHHAGLANGWGEGERVPLTGRLTKDVPDYSACWQQGDIVLPDLVPPQLTPHPTAPVARERAGLQLATFSRMLFSCLVDADWEEAGGSGDLAPGLPVTILKETLDAYLVALAASAENTEINRLRRDILATARGRALGPRGVYTMTVPTGGGKTLAGLAWALDHVVHHSLERVIYVAPYTAILDQTADVFRQALVPHDSAVVEHHTGFREPRTRAQRLSAEAWNAPILATTAVQLFESLFTNKTGRARKLHNICNSVVILDEAQTLPIHLLRPCIAVLDELARNYGVTLLLCTATQPAVIERPDEPVRSFIGGFPQTSVREIAPEPQDLYRALRRVTLVASDTMTDAQLAEAMIREGQALTIVNTRQHAQDLYRVLGGIDGSAHLTTLMCPAHRRQKLADIRRRLAEELPTLLVATSLIEAGVDVDFRAVFRAMAGLDQIAQAAGRCNREGRHDHAESYVTVFEPAGHDEPWYLRQAAQATRAVLRSHDDGLSLDAIDAFFRRLYWSRDLDDCSVLPRLNARAADMLFPHEDIAKAMHLIDDDGETILIPFDITAERLIAELPQTANLARLTRLLQPYTVNVYPRDFETLRQAGVIATATEDEQFWKLADPDSYSADLGLLINNGGQ